MLNNERSANIIDYVFEKEVFALNICQRFLSNDAFCAALDRVLSKDGTLFFTGLGKNKFVIMKTVHTINSMGIKAFFIDPIDAMHGDIGAFNNKDTVIIFSKSGQTEEIDQFIYHAKKRGVKILLITCNRNSALVKKCDQCIFLPLVEEVDDNNLIPTASTTMFLCLGDAISIYLYRFFKNSYGFVNNHPGGVIGEKCLSIRNIKEKEIIKVLIMDVDGTLTDGQIYYSNNDCFVSFNAKDGYGISTILPAHQIMPILLTGRKNNSILGRKIDLKVDYVYTENNNKLNTLYEIVGELGISLDEVAYIGDDLNDLECIKNCGLSACPADAHDRVKENSTYICSNNGGNY